MEYDPCHQSKLSAPYNNFLAKALYSTKNSQVLLEAFVLRETKR